VTRLVTSQENSEKFSRHQPLSRGGNRPPKLVPGTFVRVRHLLPRPKKVPGTKLKRRNRCKKGAWHQFGGPWHLFGGRLNGGNASQAKPAGTRTDRTDRTDQTDRTDRISSGQFISEPSCLANIALTLYREAWVPSIATNFTRSI